MGDGPERSAYEALTASLGLSDRVVFHGTRPRAEVARLMREADLLVQPSASETLSCVVLEAQVSGLPVVASDVGGIPEVVGGGAGLLVPPGDPAALAAAIEAVLGHARALRPRRDRKRGPRALRRGFDRGALGRALRGGGGAGAAPAGVRAARGGAARPPSSAFRQTIISVDGPSRRRGDQQQLERRDQRAQDGARPRPARQRSRERGPGRGEYAAVGVHRAVHEHEGRPAPQRHESRGAHQALDLLERPAHLVRPGPGGPVYEFSVNTSRPPGLSISARLPIARS